MNDDHQRPIPTDQRIVARVACGNVDALGELYDTHAPAIYALALRIVSNQADAEEVVQDVFVQVWRQSARYDASRASVAGWLLMLTRTRAIDRLRARRSRLDAFAHDDGLSELPHTSASQESLAIDGQAVQALKRALDTLPDSLRAPIELAYYEGLSHAGIAERLGQPLGYREVSRPRCDGETSRSIRIGRPAVTFDHEALRELAVASAFDTLTDAEIREFEPHLRSCPECQAAVKEAMRLAEGLALVPERSPLPPGLRERALQAALASPQPAQASRRPSPSRAIVAATALAIAATLLMIVGGSLAWSARRQARAALAELADQRQELLVTQQALARERALANEARGRSEIATAADVVKIMLVGQPAAPRALGQIFWSPSEGLIFRASRLPALPPGRVYQLWYVTAAAPVSAGLVEPDPSGEVSLLRIAPARVQPSAFALTIEPAGGVANPTGAFYLLGSR